MTSKRGGAKPDSRSEFASTHIINTGRLISREWMNGLGQRIEQLIGEKSLQFSRSKKPGICYASGPDLRHSAMERSSPIYGAENSAEVVKELAAKKHLDGAFALRGIRSAYEAFAVFPLDGAAAIATKFAIKLELPKTNEPAGRAARLFAAEQAAFTDALDTVRGNADQLYSVALGIIDSTNGQPFHVGELRQLARAIPPTDEEKRYASFGPIGGM